MSRVAIGIDFGTTTSSMAWVDPATGKAEILMNAEGELKTPSVVYFGAEETLVGTPAEQLLADEAEDEEVRWRVVASVKRELIDAPTLALPGRRVKAVEVAAAVFAKLKRDAEELYFHHPIEQAVVTCPAAFGVLEREAIEQAARLGGFTEVRLVEEPVAAALAYRCDGFGVGRHILVYDLGGGTFDLALLRQEDDAFELVMEPRGLRRCGGDDFDAALYDWYDGEARRQLGEPLDSTGRNLRLLHACRKRKESLSTQEKARFSTLVRGKSFKVYFRQSCVPVAEPSARMNAAAALGRSIERMIAQAISAGHERSFPVQVAHGSEIYFKVLKSGCRIEELQLEKRERLEPALAFYMIIAWRVLYLTMLGRDCPEMPCDTVFADEEWKAVYLVTQRKTPPEQPPSLDTMVRMVASLGGFLNRKGDGFPGDPKRSGSGYSGFRISCWHWRLSAVPGTLMGNGMTSAQSISSMTCSIRKGSWPRGGLQLPDLR